MPTSSIALFERAQKVIPGGVNSPVRAFRSVGGSPFFTVSAQGPRLSTSDGISLIDFVGTWGPAIHGHNPPEIRSAIEETLLKGTSFGTPHPLEVQMAETLTGLFPAIDKVRMVNSGTEATMSAIRLARGFTGRSKIVKFAGCYHGHSDSLLVKAGSGALTFGNPDSAGVTASTASDTIVLPFNDIGTITDCFTSYGDSIACVILEPYPANMGLILPQPGFLQKVRELCTRHNSLLVWDEVMSGFRVSKIGVQGMEPIIPDLVALGKIIGGGLPVGAFGGRGDIMDLLAPSGPVYQAGTLSGNPIALAAGLQSIRMLDERNPYPELNLQTLRLAKALQSAFEDKGIPVRIPTTTSMLSVFFSERPVHSFDDVVASDSPLFRKFFHNALNKGVFLPPSPFEAWFLSTSHDQETIDQACELLTMAIHQI